MSSGFDVSFSAWRITKTVVVEAALTSQKPSAMTRTPASAAIQTGANKGRRRRSAYSLRMFLSLLQLLGAGSNR